LRHPWRKKQRKLRNKGKYQTMFDEFKDAVSNSSISIEHVFQKYYVDAETFYFKTRRSDEYLMKEWIAKNLNIYINDLYIIGSAKTGYSIKPDAFGRPFDGLYLKTSHVSDKSDIDLAIVNNHLFEYVSDLIYDFTSSYKMNWVVNAYYNNGKEKAFNVPLKYKFIEYLSKGWYRPDFAPIDFVLSLSDIPLNSVLHEIRNKEKRKIAFGIYRDWKYFVKYQNEYMGNIRIKLINGDML
jgi:hypothetical protein